MFFNMFEIMEGLFSVVFIIVAVTIAATAVMSLRAAKRQYDNREKSHFEEAAPNSNETKTDKKQEKNEEMVWKINKKDVI